MTHSILQLGVFLSLVSLGASGALGAETLTARVSLTAASGNCPAGAVAAGVAGPMHLMLPDAGTGAPAPSMTLTGEIRDFAVAGCTVSFAGATVAPISVSVLGAVDGTLHQRGCRGYCGL